VTSKCKPEDRLERAGRLRWVPLAQMRVNPLALRDLNRARVAKLAASFDLEQIGAPVVSHRGGWYYLIDGQHRIEALKLWFGSWEGQQVQCWCYEGLTEAQEAGLFLTLNDTLTVQAFAKFKVSVQAGRGTEADIDRIVRALGLRITNTRAGGGIAAVATLRRVYDRGGAAVLSRALRIIRDAYGEAGLDGPVIEGIALVCQRYDGQLPEQRAIQRLSAAHGGVSGLVSRAGQLRQATGNATAQCVAAAAVELINRGLGGKNAKLPAWWRVLP
jgi:ParB-like nuclease domain